MGARDKAVGGGRGRGRGRGRGTGSGLQLTDSETNNHYSPLNFTSSAVIWEPRTENWVLRANNTMYYNYINYYHSSADRCQAPAIRRQRRSHSSFGVFPDFIVSLLCLSRQIFKQPAHPSNSVTKSNTHHQASFPLRCARWMDFATSWKLSSARLFCSRRCNIYCIRCYFLGNSQNTLFKSFLWPFHVVLKLYQWKEVFFLRNIVWSAICIPLTQNIAKIAIFILKNHIYLEKVLTLGRVNVSPKY